jgi:hypothetical protein
VAQKNLARSVLQRYSATALLRCHPARMRPAARLGSTSTTLNYTALHCTTHTLHCTTLHCSALHRTAQCTALHFIALHCTVLSSTALHANCTPLHRHCTGTCTAAVQCTAIHCHTHSMLHYTTLHALHCTTLHSTHNTALNNATLRGTVQQCTAVYCTVQLHTPQPPLDHRTALIQCAPAARGQYCPNAAVIITCRKCLLGLSRVRNTLKLLKQSF